MFRFQGLTSIVYYISDKTEIFEKILYEIIIIALKKKCFLVLWNKKKITKQNYFYRFSELAKFYSWYFMTFIQIFGVNNFQTSLLF